MGRPKGFKHSECHFDQHALMRIDWESTFTAKLALAA